MVAREYRTMSKYETRVALIYYNIIIIIALHSCRLFFNVSRGMSEIIGVPVRTETNWSADEYIRVQSKIFYVFVYTQ